MNTRFEVVFLDEALSFLQEIDKKHAKKILYNIRKVQTEQDAGLLKKLNNDIWEFRTLYQGLQYRLLAFWDKSSDSETLVVATHGFIKKDSKVPSNEIDKAIQMRVKYFNKKDINL
ncbi:MAG: type II toxin-antitoxin system RelE/ParE family toxin [Bernardetiaceae bacterium]|nr:type II toxin-antitoxin system RelE/ParE family toxin [Bernardetiaceae bacterium]